VVVGASTFSNSIIVLFSSLHSTQQPRERRDRRAPERPGDDEDPRQRMQFVRCVKAICSINMGVAWPAQLGIGPTLKFSSRRSISCLRKLPSADGERRARHSLTWLSLG
jgi:hypothetical protein